MKKQLVILLVFITLVVGCSTQNHEKESESDQGNNINAEVLGDIVEDNIDEKQEKENKADVIYKEMNNEKIMINIDGENIEDRFDIPEGYERLTVEDNSFGKYLRSLPLKSYGSKVKYYNGNVKNKKNVYEAVIDMDIGKKDLQQCADAVMRLRGEYLYNKGDYHNIHFNFTNGFRVDYSKWMEGYRVGISGNKTSYIKKKEPSNSYKDFRNYMEIIFMYAGTLSLSQELEAVELEKMQIGDVLIQGGSPGHAVIVVDMAVNKGTGDKIFMLAQSYMPAQDIQVLCNRNNKDISPWYNLEDTEVISTPEWTFSKNDLKRFIK